MLVDTHAHLTHDALWPDRENVLHRCSQRGVRGVVNICLSQIDLERAEQLSSSTVEIAHAAGVHPTSVGQSHQIAFFDQIVKWAMEGRLAAIGETGLDSVRAASSLDEQSDQLIEHLDLAESARLPVIVHCRGPGTFPKLLQVLEQREGRRCSGVVHCFSEGPEALEALSQLDWFVGFGGLMTYSRARAVRESAARVKGNRFVLETDCPFLSPAPDRKEPNEPVQTARIAEFFAQLRSQNPKGIAELATQNTLELFPALRSWRQFRGPIEPIAT